MLFDLGSMRIICNLTESSWLCFLVQVDLRRAYNCEIMLTKIKIPLPDMIVSPCLSWVIWLSVDLFILKILSLRLRNLPAFDPGILCLEMQWGVTYVKIRCSLSLVVLRVLSMATFSSVLLSLIILWIDPFSRPMYTMSSFLVLVHELQLLAILNLS